MLCRQGPFPGTPGNGPCLNQDLTMFVISGSCLAVGSEHLGDLVRNDVLDILAAVADVLSGIEVIGMSHEVLADTCGHTKTKVRVDVDLADSTFCCHTKLFLGDTDGILQSAAVCIDNLYIFLRNGGRTMKNDREARKSSGNFFENVESEWWRYQDAFFVSGALFRFELVCAMGSTDGDRQRIAACSGNEFFDVFRSGVG